MAGRLKNIKIPEALPVVIQLDNTALDGFLKNLMSALQEMGSELIDAKQSASTSEATTVHVLQEMATLKEQIEDERKKQKALVVQMEGERTKTAALAESLNRSFDMHAGGLMKVEEELQSLKAHTKAFEADAARQLSSHKEMMPHLLGNLKVVQESQASLSTKMASVCTSQQHAQLQRSHDTLQKNFDTLKSEFATSQEENRALRAKIDAMGQRVKRIENAVQGIEGNLELEDEPVVGAEEVMMLKATVEELKKSVQKSHKSVEELVKRMDNEGANFDETLVKVDQVSDHIAAFEKKLQIQTRKISDLESDAAANKSLADVFASMTMPQGGTAEDPRAALAFQIAQQVQAELKDVKNETIELRSAGETTDRDIRDLKSSVKRLKGMTAVPLKEDHADVGKGVAANAEEIEACRRSVGNLWSVVKDLGERIRAGYIHDSHDTLAETLYGVYATESERTLLFPIPPPGGKPPGKRPDPKDGKGAGEVVVLEKAWDLKETVYNWSPLQGEAPWIGKGIVTVIKTKKAQSSEEIMKKMASKAEVQAVIKELGGVQERVEDLETSTESLRKHAEAQTKKSDKFGGLIDHIKGQAEECLSGTQKAMSQVASTEADLVGLKQQLGVFMGRMDKEICSKADIQALQVLVSHTELYETLDKIAAVWGEQLQKAHTEVSMLKRGLSHVQDRSGAGLVKCIGCGGPMPAPKGSLYWTRPGIDPILSPGRSGTTYRLAHKAKPPKTAAPSGAASSPSKRLSTAVILPVITPRADDGVGGGGQYLRSDATGGWEDKDSGNDSKVHDSMQISAMPLISSA